jgi:hypothetical protein
MFSGNSISRPSGRFMMGSLRHEGAARVCVWTACAAGVVHALFSLYWAIGGSWLLDTVGPDAVRMSADARLLTGLGLGLVAAAKTAAAVVPVNMAYGRLRREKLWRGLSWAGALLLVLYGGANTVVGNAVLAGLVSPDGGYDRAAMAGHSWLWDPLFLLWGLALLGYLLLSGPAQTGSGLGPSTGPSRPRGPKLQS